MKCTYTNANYPKLGTITGTCKNEEGEYLFFPDKKYHQLVYTLMKNVEPVAGLWAEGPGITITPAK